MSIVCSSVASRHNPNSYSVSSKKLSGITYFIKLLYNRSDSKSVTHSRYVFNRYKNRIELKPWSIGVHKKKISLFIIYHPTIRIIQDTYIYIENKLYFKEPLRQNKKKIPWRTHMLFFFSYDSDWTVTADSNCMGKWNIIRISGKSRFEIEREEKRFEI